MCIIRGALSDLQNFLMNVLVTRRLEQSPAILGPLNSVTYLLYTLWLFSPVIFSCRQYLIQYILKKIGNNCCIANEDEEKKLIDSGNSRDLKNLKI